MSIGRTILATCDAAAIRQNLTGRSPGHGRQSDACPISGRNPDKIVRLGA
jgi:hypothetical protein